jgi:hypothetical protein
MKNLHKALFLSSSLLAGAAQAEIAFNGFASIVGGITSSDETLEGYDDSFDFSQGSLLAIQASSDLGEGVSVTAQILSRGSDDWDTSFEWAYVAYDATDNLRFLAGRQRIPFYMYSDFLDVSYAYPWISPPSSVYSVAFDTFDGLAALYTTSLGEFDTNIHMVYGRNNSEMTISGEVVVPDFKGLTGISITSTRDWLTLRAGYFQTEMNIDLQSIRPLIDTWNAVGYPDVADSIEASEDTGAFIEVGFQIDYDNILIIGEYTDLNLDGTLLPNQEAYYVFAGYRIDNMMVHLTYGGRDYVRGRLTNDVVASPGLVPLIAATNGASDSQAEESTYTTLGLRWDFHDSASLKFEYTAYSDDLNSNNDAGLFRTALVTVF